jgi:preprotein translocase subunit SecF
MNDWKLVAENRMNIVMLKRKLSLYDKRAALLMVIFVLFSAQIVLAIAAKDKDAWCREGSRQSAALEEARQRLDEAEIELRRAQFAGHQHDAGLLGIRNAQENVEQAKLDVDREEKAVANLEKHASEKGIPLGWLNCRFEY